jgi:hypothetical protein
MKARKLIVLVVIAAMASLGIIPTSLAAHSAFAPIPQTTTIPMLPGAATQPIKVARGYQEYPQVACNVATYTDFDDEMGTESIKYFDFATNTEHVVPGIGLDFQADTDGRRIAFTRIDVSGTEPVNRIAIFDIASQTTIDIPVQGMDPSIGGNLIAFGHGRFEGPTSQIYVHDLNTGALTQLTNDALLNRDPEVSSDGSVVVWQKCQLDGKGCDIYSATQTGPGVFTAPRLLTGAGEDWYPHTNGQFVVYTSDKSGENDVYFQRVGGSSEMHLSLPDEQYDPHISGNALVFVSRVPMSTRGNSEIFLYDLSTARLYQATNTGGAAYDADVVAGCSGINRIVYMAVGPYGDWDVHELTFQLRDSINDQLNDLIALVQSFNLHDGTEASLITKLQDAIAAVNASATATACDSLTAFINASQAQSGKKLTADQVKQLVDAAAQIKSDLGCQ